MSREAAVRESFSGQALYCGNLGSPFMRQLLLMLSARLDRSTSVGARVLDWPGDPRGAADALSLRLAAGLHALVLREIDTGLIAAYPPNRVSDDLLWRAVTKALQQHQNHLHDWLDRAPQTNEVRRSAVLIAAAHLLTDIYHMPLVLSELGSSAGLNLLWDHYALDLNEVALGPEHPVLTLSPNWRGPLPPPARVQVAARAGVDLTPVHPVKDRLRLLSYVWPDQPDRKRRTEIALDLAAHYPPLVDQGEAADWARHRLAERFAGRLHLVFHTVAWQYFPSATRKRISADLALAGERASDDAPLAHLQVESDGKARGARVALTLWPGGVTLELGRADFHGRWVDWRDPLM